MKNYEDIEIISGSGDLLDRIQPLWEALREYHASQSRHFAAQMRQTPFELRRKRFARLAETGNLLSEIAWDGPSSADVGYSISSVESEDGILWGCMESLYIAPEFRGRQIGVLLTKRSLDWFRSLGCDKILVSVAEGNEAVFDFYREFGFEVRYTVMELKQD